MQVRRTVCCCVCYCCCWHVFVFVVVGANQHAIPYTICINIFLLPPPLRLLPSPFFRKGVVGLPPPFSHVISHPPSLPLLQNACRLLPDPLLLSLPSLLLLPPPFLLPPRPKPPFPDSLLLILILPLTLMHHAPSPPPGGIIAAHSTVPGTLHMPMSALRSRMWRVHKDW